MSNPGALKLNAAVKGLEDLKTEFGEYKAKARDSMKLLGLRNAELKERLEDAEDKIEWLAGSLGVDQALGERDAEEQQEREQDQQPGDAGSVGADDDLEEVEGAVSAARVKRSRGWKDAKVIKVSD